jgi:poly(3-hydroxybutyrate) depolymerase
MKYTFYILLLILAQSCSSGTQQENTGTEAGDTVVTETLPAGEVIDSILLKNNSAQSYALYIPTALGGKKSVPLVLILDPQGEGRLPVRKYRELAEKFGFVIAASNNFRNQVRWEETNSIIEQMAGDLMERLSPDQNNIHIMGFSGGARAAHSFGMQHSYIRSIICCGAVVPAVSVVPRTGTSMLLVTGNHDFNYREICRYDMVEFAAYPIRHSLLRFEGKHEWPQEAAAEDIFLWLRLNEMRKDPKLKNETLVASKLKEHRMISDSLQKGNYDYELYLHTKKTITYFDHVADLSDVYLLWKTLEKNSLVDAGLKAETLLWQEEEQVRNGLLQKVVKQPESAAKEIASIAAKSGKKGDARSDMYTRVLEYCSVVFYGETNSAIRRNDLVSANHFSALYIQADPKNAEAHYLSAVILAKEGNKSMSMKKLGEAVNLGFRHAARLRTEEAFVSMNSEPEFQKVLSAAEINEKNILN